jgi:hypothetical protein
MIVCITDIISIPNFTSTIVAAHIIENTPRPFDFTAAAAHAMQHGRLILNTPYQPNITTFIISPLQLY